MIVAVASNGVIGKDSKMPWHLPSDLQHFKRVTSGHAVVMGRKTFESIGRTLPDRLNIVLSRQSPSMPQDMPPDVALATTPQAAVELAKEKGHEELFVMGGGEVYRLFEPLASRIFLTEVKATLDGDTYFAIQNPNDWHETSRTTQKAGEKDSANMDFVILEREHD